MFVLYHAPGSSSMAAAIALHEVGAAFETRVVSLLDRAKDPPEFRGVNPEGKVPTLVVDGHPLTEVAGVLFYLARAFPAAGLLPGDALGDAHVVSWMSFTASTIHPARRQGPEHVKAVYRSADQRLAGKDWTVGAYSIADIHLFRLFWRFRGAIGADAETYPNLCAHYDRMMQRPAVVRTLQQDAAIGYALPA